MQSALKRSESINGLLSGSAQEDHMPIHIDVDVALPSVVICRFKAPLYYGNAEFFMDEVLSIVRFSPLRLRWFILRFDSINAVDYIGAKMLTELADRLQKEQVALVFAELSTDLRRFLFDSDVLEAVGLNKVFASVDAALASLKPTAR
jgi:MFS superfamily sulfate permease-like transporter